MTRLAIFFFSGTAFSAEACLILDTQVAFAETQVADEQCKLRIKNVVQTNGKSSVGEQQLQLPEKNYLVAAKYFHKPKGYPTE